MQARARQDRRAAAIARRAAWSGRCRHWLRGPAPAWALAAMIAAWTSGSLLLAPARESTPLQQALLPQPLLFGSGSAVSLRLDHQLITPNEPPAR